MSTKHDSLLLSHAERQLCNVFVSLFVSLPVPVGSLPDPLAENIPDPLAENIPDPLAEDIPDPLRLEQSPRASNKKKIVKTRNSSSSKKFSNQFFIKVSGEIFFI